ncbi:MAG: DnaJ domain-containing protein [Bacteroidales bacterium]|jgi:DnaJ like chaperone protein|nr:DnaJ domain-containing protein [Bacteroidales bacterium]
MSSIGRWIGALLGLIFFGFFGAVIGYFLGYIYDFVSTKQSSGTVNISQRGSFISYLMALTAAVLKSDHIVKKIELDVVKQFLLSNFGEQDTLKALQILKDYLDNGTPIDEVCYKIKHSMTTPLKLQILHYLYQLGNADGALNAQELGVIENIAIKIGLSYADNNSIKNMFIVQTDSAYEILGVSKNSSDDEIKKAYRDMAKKYHPDKVNTMGEDVKNAAKEKFQKVNQAYDAIRKERNMK